ncbi:prefoldin subunit beta [Sulfolobus acidocaldarius]|uniref:Prefoldin subunit beta n=4 Tax=Sulfolobus acidocaldarius TaxID=2285 RepID=PFDB_SULAC|nr:prefoldin subunit beta [Sulfolobus acidocaldarius]Q4JB32.1 RecName: Full=Prefoldin subunit beta; AltName: Full=GimC subunit beta [Sulfolobus acidocaldarius DSM 639]AHC51011.1 prefoldin subunit beta [Sulfolobus acidocaldarius SUSAZ]AAY79997.1 prefoldin beta subunit [Sulfolobus acidocaldarius DSM 639]AGE70566.1 prefoldin subunit beta [Sulfolobus acidocaldarius N8]AGE72839.1 prefoldin subunit beta [Sulfolobus acidocaldarius Ron12/I]ALU29075.1 prefoldin subunit beta [Sulfolobus acidocaldarius]
MTERLPPELQTELVKLQQLQEQLNRVIAERSVIDSQLREVNKVLDELKQLPSDTIIYKIVGNLLVKVNKDNVEKELDDQKTILELRSRTYQNQETKLRTQLEEKQKKVNEMLSKYYPQRGAGAKA